MFTPKIIRRWCVSIGILLALVLVGFVFYVAKRARPVPSAADAARPEPAPTIVIPALPAPPTSAGAVPAAGQPLPELTADWLTQRFPDSQILQQREQPAIHDGTFQREYLLDSQFKYPAVEVRETWQRVAPASGVRAASGVPSASTAPGSLATPSSGAAVSGAAGAPAPAEKLLKREAWVADHFLLKPRPGLNVAALAAAVSASGGSLDQSTLARNGLLIVRLAQPDLGAVRAAVAAFSRANGPAVFAEPDYLVFTATIPNDPSFSQQWGLEDGSSNGDINAATGWDIRTSAAGVLVAVIDTGVRYTHVDLRDNIWQNPGEIAGNGLDDDHDGWVDDVHGVNFYGNTADPNDDEGHGTHVAGILGATGNNGVGIAGVAWQVTVMPIKFQDSHGVGASSDAVRAIDFAVAHGAQILSNSWGSNSFSQALHDSIAAAGAAGVLCVAAAGNDHVNTDLTPVYPAGFDVDTVIAVGNEGGGYPVYSSNFGTKSVDLFAPGYNIYSLGIASDSDYATLTGTSQATPFVSGALALLKAEFPDKSAAWLKQRLLETARPNGNLYNYAATGAQLDLYNALAHITPAPVAITSDPVASDVYSGEAVNLYLETTGGGNVQYQWYKNDVALAGQTSASLSLANPTAADSGDYYAIVHNYASSARSKTVTIAVRNSAPQLTLAPVGARVLAGQSVYLKSAFKGSQPMTFQWERNGSPVDGGTGAELYLYPIAAGQEGTYRLKATNAFGSFTTDPVLVTLVSTYLETWEQVAPKPTSESLQKVAWLNGGFVAVGGNGAIARSADGAQWQLATTSGTTSYLFGAAYGNSTYVAVGGYATIVSSTDGDHWTSRLSGSGQFTDVAFGNGAFVAVGGYSAYRSTDGINWGDNAITDYLSLSSSTIAFGNGHFVVAGQGSNGSSNTFSSTDGITWTKASLSNQFGSAAISFADGTFWLSTGSNVYTSTDGLGWTLFRSGSFGRLLPSGDWLYFTSQYSQLVSRMSKTDPQDATAVLSNIAGLPDLHSLAAGAGRIVAVGDSGAILASSDGAVFGNVSHFTTNQVIGLLQFNGQFIAVDAHGALFTSTDGAGWSHLSDVPRVNNFALISATAANGRIVATSEDGRSYASTDGVQWTNQLIGPQQRFFNSLIVSSIGDYFWIPSRNSDPVYRSSDGLNWTAAARLPQGYGGGRYLAWDYDNGIVVGVSTDAATWQFHAYPGVQYGGAIFYDGAKFHLVDGSGYLTSGDGVTWTNTPTTGLDSYPGQLFVQDGVFMATGSGISLSLDGVTWVKKVNAPALAIVSPGIVLARLLSSGPTRILRAARPYVAPPGAPMAVTVAAIGVHSRQATLTGTVDCSGADTTITFAWGQTGALGQSVTLPLAAASRGAQLFSAAALNLLPATPYYFQISATNSEGTSVGDTLTFTTLANTPPVAVDDGPIVVAAQGATAIPVLANDTDADGDGDALAIASFTTPQHGTVAATATGLSYTPAAGFSGSDQFTYTIQDPSGATATATVRVRSNAAPIGTEDVYEQVVGPGPFLLPVLNNDHDPDGDALTLLRVDSGSHGIPTISGQAVIYQPRTGYAGPDQFYYLVGDPYGKTAYVKVTLHLLPGRPAAPVAALLVGSGETFFQTPPEFYFADGTKISGFGPPALSDFRHIASTITLAVGRTTLSGILFQEPNGARSVLAATTVAAPGAATSTFLSFSNPVLSPHGALAFIARTKAPGARGAITQGVWSNAFTGDGSLGLALKSGTPLSGNGLPAGASVATLTSVEAVDGALYVLGQLSAPGGAVLLRIDATGPHVLLHVRGALSPGVTISSMSVLQPALASAGQGRWGGAQGLVVKATLSDKSIALLKIAPDGSVSRLLSTWQAPAPGDSFAWSAFGLPALTPDGGAAFTGTVKTGAKAVLGRRGSTTTDTKLAEVGQTATDAGVAQYASFYDPVVGDHGFAFLALLRGTGVTTGNRVGLWWNDETQTHKLARLGEAAPDAAGHVITPAINGPRWLALSSIALPGGAQGGPVVLGKVAGKTVTAANNTGLWALDSAGVFRQLLRTGPGQIANDARSISSITALAADAGAFGVGRSYNSTGSLAVKVVFTNGTQALLRLDIP